MVQVIEVDPEPAHTLVPGGVQTLPLKLTAVADSVRYECDVKAIQFRGTVMFQSRSFAFDVKNVSKAKMEYSWAVLKKDGGEDSSKLFAVNPEDGTVLAGQTGSFTVRFSPVEVVDCNRMLVCNVFNLDPGSGPLSIPLDGKVIRPWCHFEFPEGTGTIAERRVVTPENGEGRKEVGTGSETLRILEFQSLGTRVRNTKRFHVLNPTSIAYEFLWEQQAVGRGAKVSEEGDEPPGGSRSVFTCATRRGVIAGGKRCEMAFEYTPENQEPQESSWVFRIPEQDIAVPFQLAGKVVEPRVSLDRASVNFGKVLVGGKGREVVTLVNEEHLPFPFSFEKLVPDGTGHSDGPSTPLVHFEPSAGTLAPDSRLPVTVTYVPAEEKPVNMNVVCLVKRKAVKLTLNVKGEGYAVHDSLQMAGRDGAGPIELAPVGRGAPNFIEYGQVRALGSLVFSKAFESGGSVNYRSKLSSRRSPLQLTGSAFQHMTRTFLTLLHTFPQVPLLACKECLGWAQMGRAEGRR
jgi:hydrocephalus-inducing protein